MGPLMLDPKNPALMNIPTEPIGSIPRPLRLIEAFNKTACDDPALDPLYEEAIRDTLSAFRGNRLAGGDRRRTTQVS